MTWTEQWARVGRYLTKVETIYSGRPEGATDDFKDDVFAFCQIVHHLKDWLANDPAITLSRRTLDNEVNGNLWLQLCADLANGQKHFGISNHHQPRTGDRSTAITKNGVTINVRTRGGFIQHVFVVESNGNEYDMLDIARNAVADWRTFLEHRSLL